MSKTDTRTATSAPPSTAGNTGQSRAALDLLRHAAAPERAHLRRGVAWLLLAAALEAISPLLGKTLIDQHLVPHHLDLPRMAALLCSMWLLGLAASGVRYFQLTRFAGVAMRSVRRLREQVYSHVLRLPMAFFDKAITGQLVSRVTNDTEQVKNLYVQVLFVMLDSSIVVLGAVLAMAWLDWRLMLLVLLLFPAVVVIVWFYQRWSAPAVARARERRSDINAQMAESIAGMAVLQSSNAEERFRQRFGQTNEQHYQARMAELRANAWLLRPMLDLLNVLLLMLVFYSFGQRHLDAAEVGVLYAFVSYIGRVVNPLIEITLQFGQLQQAIVAAARVNTLLQEEAPPRSFAARNSLPPEGAFAPWERPGGAHSVAIASGTRTDERIGDGQVSLKDVVFGYDAARPVLHSVSLDIAAGSFIGVVGHTGSGKSTLLSLLLRFYTPQRGSISIDGVPLAAFRDDDFRADVGLVPQDPFLLAGSVRENIAMGRPLSEAQIEAAARAAHCHDFVMQLERGYDTPLGEGGARLSVGQKQLIAIARALAGTPRILFLDEATAHIDSETEQVVQQALNELRGQVTLIAIAHRLSTIRDADRIIVLNHGRLHEQGSHQELMALPAGLYQRLYAMQQME